MYAIIETGSKQFTVKEGDKISVEKLSGETGEEVTFDQVLLVNDGKATHVGAPTVAGATVQAKVLGAVRGEKIHFMKFKRRKNCRKKHGHRQNYTRVEIVGIAVKGKKGKTHGA